MLLLAGKGKESQNHLVVKSRPGSDRPRCERTLFLPLGGTWSRKHRILSFDLSICKMAVRPVPTLGLKEQIGMRSLSQA